MVRKNRRTGVSEDTAEPLHPTHVFYIFPHLGFNTIITVVDLTLLLPPTNPTLHFARDADAFFKRAKEIAESSNLPAFLTASKPHWYSKTRTIRLHPHPHPKPTSLQRHIDKDTDATVVAEWIAPHW